MDIDDYKDVNDSLGHEQGDALLVQLSARLNDCVRPQDLVARLGGDEFAVVVIEDEGEPTAIGVAERILGSLREPFIVNGARVLVSVSISASSSPWAAPWGSGFSSPDPERAEALDPLLASGELLFVNAPA